MDRIIAFASGKKSGNVRPLFEIDPKPAHRIMHAGEDAHRHISRIVADEHFIDLKDRSQTFGQNVRGNVREIQIDLILTRNAVTLETHLEDLTGSNVTRNEISVGRV